MFDDPSRNYFNITVTVLWREKNSKIQTLGGIQGIKQRAARIQKDAGPFAPDFPRFCNRP